MMNGDFKTKVLIEVSKQEKKNTTYFKFIIIFVFIGTLFLFFLIFKDNFKKYFYKTLYLKNKSQLLVEELVENNIKENSKDDLSKVDDSIIEVNLNEECEKYKLQLKLCNIKNLFQITLKDLNDELNNFLSNNNNYNIYPNQYNEIKKFKKKSLEYFSSEKYKLAYEEIKYAKNSYDLILKDSKKFFEISMQEAEKAYVSRNEEAAKNNIFNAEKYFPKNQNMIKLKEKIENISAIIKTENEIINANLEKNISLELNLIKKIKKFDKYIIKYDNRFLELEDLLKKKNFENLIMKIKNQLEINEISRAKENLKYAKNLFPKNKIIASITDEIKYLEKTRAINMLKKDIEKGISKQKWDLVEKKYEEILDLDDTNYYAVKGIKVAKEINILIEKIKIFNSKPMMLIKDDNINTAVTLLNKSKLYKGYSTKLSKNASSLLKNMNLVKEPAIVNITSDNNTKITLKKIGIIGKVFSKTIKLKPGNYTFEGRRDGYKTVLIDKMIDIDEKEISLNIISYEPIK